VCFAVCDGRSLRFVVLGILRDFVIFVILVGCWFGLWFDYLGGLWVVVSKVLLWCDVGVLVFWYSLVCFTWVCFGRVYVCYCFGL